MSSDRFDTLAGGEQRGEALLARGRQIGRDSLLGGEQVGSDVLAGGEQIGGETLTGGEQRGPELLMPVHRSTEPPAVSDRSETEDADSAEPRSVA
jgi:hypothetical protein